ncbi:putative O-methyltransferase YrrM [Thermosporothrix hazakensis]|jgi:caffeoyl-CoA O-methyltransferase|uniref:O-methyltransferase n=2 Tax=Thermosporothrix TaxID=768650 RepID=A0A455SI82_9CHLR|nr:O-methyltransferase [Thermosporothrix hazakensis]PZW31157.1 putative O-methyltransferase YrrM [Thermosporothrix hazakensis]BBH86622.1 O-methyltransferase [Thermosporothrix sp. COM3]GCE50931.1 O-methyltransferase [Thermosporothrix hazakensis]
MYPSESEARARINHELAIRFAPEDEALRASVASTEAAGLPGNQVSPLQGKLLHVLALTCGARKILEIGSLAGYSGVWLARALPEDGKLITLEVNPEYAALARKSFHAAGLDKRTEVRVGPALDLLPALTDEAPFDLIFIDADKVNNSHYLEWALRLSRPGSLIIADNIVRSGRPFQTPPPDESAAGAAAYIHKILEHPRLVSVALPWDDAVNGLDGFSISVVR